MIYSKSLSLQILDCGSQFLESFCPWGMQNVSAMECMSLQCVFTDWKGLHLSSLPVLMPYHHPSLSFHYVLNQSPSQTLSHHSLDLSATAYSNYIVQVGLCHFLWFWQSHICIFMPTFVYTCINILFICCMKSLWLIFLFSLVNF